MVIKKFWISLRREYVVHAREEVHADRLVEALLRNRYPLDTGWLGDANAELKALIDTQVEHLTLSIPDSGWRTSDSREAILYFGGELHHWRDGSWVRRPVRTGFDPIAVCKKYAQLMGMEPMTDEQVAELTADSLDDPSADDLGMLDEGSDPESIH